MLVDDTSKASIDLWKATKLRDLVFRSLTPSVAWVVTALKTITSNHRNLQRITINFRSYDPAFADTGTNVGQTMAETTYGEWLDLDRLLVQFWELYSVRTKVVTSLWDGKRNMESRVGRFLPETTKRGAIDLVEYYE